MVTIKILFYDGVTKLQVSHKNSKDKDVFIYIVNKTFPSIFKRLQFVT